MASISSVLRSILVRFWTCYFWWDFDFLEGEYLGLLSTSIKRSKKCNDEITIFIPLSGFVMLGTDHLGTDEKILDYPLIYLQSWPTHGHLNRARFWLSFCQKQSFIENGYLRILRRSGSYLKNSDHFWTYLQRIIYLSMIVKARGFGQFWNTSVLDGYYRLIS